MSILLYDVEEAYEKVQGTLKIVKDLQSLSLQAKQNPVTNQLTSVLQSMMQAEEGLKNLLETHKILTRQTDADIPL